VPAAIYNTLQLRKELARHNKGMAEYLSERLQGAGYILRSQNNRPSW